MNSSGSGRVQWGSYGFLAGIVIGLLMGWMFHGFVGAFVRIGLVAIALVPLVMAYLAWRKFVAPWLRPTADQQYAPTAAAIETRGVVRGTVHEPRTR